MDSGSNIGYADVELILQDCFLFALDVINNIPAVSEDARFREGYQLTDALQKALQVSPVTPAAADNILYAICALLDETVLATGNIPWRHNPLQTRYFQTLNAGNELFERLREVLRQPAPDQKVLTTFHHVLRLGFLGKYYQTPDAPELQTLLRNLASQIHTDNRVVDEPVVASLGLSRWSRHWRSPWLMVAVSLLLVMALSLGLHLHLHGLLANSGMTD